jgi:hypothetical protein
MKNIGIKSKFIGHIQRFADVIANACVSSSNSAVIIPSNTQQYAQNKFKQRNKEISERAMSVRNINIQCSRKEFRPLPPNVFVLVTALF